MFFLPLPSSETTKVEGKVVDKNRQRATSGLSFLAGFHDYLSITICAITSLSAKSRQDSSVVAFGWCPDLHVNL